MIKGRWINFVNKGKREATDGAQDDSKITRITQKVEDRKRDIFNNNY